MADKKKGRPHIVHPSEINNWNEKYGENTYLPRAILCAQTLIENEFIDEEHEFACYLLFKSIESRIHSCRYEQGIYKGVHCAWSDPISGLMDIIKYKSDMWSQWVEQTKIFLEKDQQQSCRPTVDRIETNPDVGYRLSNIAMLPFGKNSYKAQVKPVYAFEMSNNQSVGLPTFRKFDSITEAKQELGLQKLDKDSGMFTNTQDGRQFLIQSESATSGLESVQTENTASKKKKEYVGYIPIGQVEIDGQLYTVNQPFTFEQMQITLKKQD
ncbi:hypothetical protein MKX40_22195 [Paenibacillus sp. FSL R5-0517]|uniref:hypothetical protein n=1 Tax=Paenibacillus sp. FSL R5-0517 TaxID=2921647 RepID=UPI0030DCEAB0